MSMSPESRMHRARQVRREHKTETSMRITLLCLLGLDALSRRGMMVIEVKGFHLPSPISNHNSKNHWSFTRRGIAIGTRCQATDPLESWGDLKNDTAGVDFMAQFMSEVNKREGLRRKEGIRTLKRPSALLPPHAVLEHVLGSLRTPDFPTDGCGLRQSFLFSALDQEVSRGPADYRRDWTDPNESRPRCLDKDSHDAVLRNAVGFLVGMSDFVVTGAPIFSEDDHRVTFPVRIIPDEHTSALRWVLMDFRLGRVREGSHKDCWLVERVIERDREGPPDVLGI